MQLASLINDIKSVIGDSNRRLKARCPIALSQVGPESTPAGEGAVNLLAKWDGSFQEGKGAGIGITVSRVGEDSHIITLGMPVKTTDASRTEMLGATLVALVVSMLKFDTLLM